MPAPTNKNTTDFYLYNYIVNPIANKICFVSPNFVTLLSTLLIYPIVKNVLNKGSLKNFMILMFIRYFLDCLDGAIAGECDKKSKFGAFFDILSDFTMIMSLNLIVFYTILKNKARNIINISVLAAIMIISIFAIKNILSEIFGKRSSKGQYFTNEFHKFIEDNGLVSMTLYSLFVKKFT